MVGFWSRNFSADGKERSIAEREYAACEEARTALLMKFRRQAAEEVVARNGPSLFLISRHSRSFLSISENGASIAWGNFGDEFVPQLEFVDTRSEVVATKDIKSEVNRFRHRMWQYDLLQRNARNDILRRMTPYEIEMRTVGYQVLTYHSTKVYSLRIEFDGEPLSGSYRAASKSLFDRIMLASPPTEDRASIVQLIVGVEVSEVEGQTFDTEFAYFDDRGRSDERRREHRLKVCSQIVPFVARVTSQMGDGALDDRRYELVQAGPDDDPFDFPKYVEVPR